MTAGRTFDPVRLELGGPVEDCDRLLHAKYERRVRRFFVKKGVREEDAEDLTQETFQRVFRTRAKLDNREQLEAWLFEIAVNVWHNEQRARATLKRAAVVVSLDEPDEQGGPRSEVASEAEPDALKNAITGEQRAILGRALQELPEQMRRCVLFRVGQGRKYREIAVAMNISIGTVKAHLHQAKLRLRTLLGPRFGPIDF